MDVSLFSTLGLSRAHFNNSDFLHKLIAVSEESVAVLFDEVLEVSCDLRWKRDIAEHELIATWQEHASLIVYLRPTTVGVPLKHCLIPLRVTYV